MWHRVLVTNNTTHTQSYAYPLVWKQQLTPRSNLVPLCDLEKGRTIHPYVMNTKSTSANPHDECAMKRMSKHTSIIDLSSPVELVKDFHVRYTICIVLRSRCEDRDNSMLVVHVQNKDTSHGRPMLLETKQNRHVWCSLDMFASPWRSDIGNILRGSANRSTIGMVGRRCLVVCRNDEAS